LLERLRSSLQLVYLNQLHCTVRTGLGMAFLRGRHWRNFCWSAMKLKLFIDTAARWGSRLRKSQVFQGRLCCRELLTNIPRIVHGCLYRLRCPYNAVCRRTLQKDHAYSEPPVLLSSRTVHAYDKFSLVSPRKHSSFTLFLKLLPSHHQHINNGKGNAISMPQAAHTMRAGANKRVDLSSSHSIVQAQLLAVTSIRNLCCVPSSLNVHTWNKDPI
jgi:hypothetical protein